MKTQNSGGLLFEKICYCCIASAIAIKTTYCYSRAIPMNKFHLGGNNGLYKCGKNSSAGNN